jgi:hypothetical protein
MQALMARRVMAETDARELYRELCRVDNGACGQRQRLWLCADAAGCKLALPLAVCVGVLLPPLTVPVSLCPADTGFDAFWGVCNKELSFLGLDIRRVNLPPEADEAPVRYVGVVNKVNDSLAKEATRMTPPQVALFRAIVRVPGGLRGVRRVGVKAKGACG